MDPALVASMRRQECERCGRIGPTDVHHIRTRAACGDDVPRNLVSLCRTCHRRFHDGNIPRQELQLIADEREDQKMRRMMGHAAYSRESGGAMRQIRP